MFWNDAFKLGSSLWANGVAMQETALAAAGVIRHRSGVIDAAMRNPLDADARELDRMVREKVDAFGRAGRSLADDWLGIHADLLAQGHDVAMLFAGWPPKPGAAERIGRRGARLAVKLSTAGGRALAPVHATATANQRRLNKRPIRQ